MVVEGTMMSVETEQERDQYSLKLDSSAFIFWWKVEISSAEPFMDLCKDASLIEPLVGEERRKKV